MHRYSNSSMKICNSRVTRQGTQLLYLQKLGAEVSGDGLHEVDSTLGRVGGGANLTQMRVDGSHSTPNGIQGACSEQFIDRKVLHERAIVVHFVLGFLQAWMENEHTMAGHTCTCTCMYMYIYIYIYVTMHA